LKILDFRFKELFHFYSKQWSDTRRKRLRCASDFHKSKIINLRSTIPWTGPSGLGDLLLQIEASHAKSDKFIKLDGLVKSPTSALCCISQSFNVR
jgi:hypothetical protein